MRIRIAINIGIFLVCTVFLCPCYTFARRVKGESSNSIFVHYRQLPILEGKTEPEIMQLNAHISDFVLRTANANTIISISEPIPCPSESGRTVTYRLDVLTDNGKVSVCIKQTNEIEGQQTEKASELGIAPESEYISSGYLVSKYFEGIKLSTILWDPSTLLENENYKWIFEQLGQMIAGMQGNIFYSDHIHFNTLVNLKTKEMKVIDFQIAHALNPADQVRILISGLDVGPDLKQTMLRIFEEAYSEGRTI